jgi:hypothetical protein
MSRAGEYENMGGGAASRAKIIRIDGETVGSESERRQLTILPGHLRVPFDGATDPTLSPAWGWDP